MNIHPQKFGRVAVLMGGLSVEREVSLMSGEAVLKALVDSGIDAFAIDVRENICQRLLDEKIDRAFNILHGPGGEDGKIQGLLETLNIPYTGCDVTASALTMDKIKTKLIFQASQIPTPKWLVYESGMSLDHIIQTLGLPLCVKPVHQGSTLGLTQVLTVEQLAPAIEKAAALHDDIIIEPWIKGQELTVGILDQQALPIIHIESPRGLYDYEAKYFSDETLYHCPSGLDPQLEKYIQSLCLKAYRATGCRHWARVDLILDEQQQPWLLEINTTPGMTSHSLVPKAAAVMGMDFNQLVVKILSLTLKDSAS